MLTEWRARCIHSRLTGLIVLPSCSIISESIASGKRDGSGEDTPLGEFRAHDTQLHS